MAERGRAVYKALSEVDPDFRELLGLLYGDAVDAEDVWLDVVAKLSPGPSDVHANGTDDGEGLRRYARAANLLAMTAGATATAQAVRAARSPEGMVPGVIIRGAKKLVPAVRKHPYKAAAIGTAAFQGFDTANDIAVQAALRHRQRTAEVNNSGEAVGKRVPGGVLVPVDKASVPELRAGIGRIARRVGDYVESLGKPPGGPLGPGTPWGPDGPMPLGPKPPRAPKVPAAQRLGQAVGAHPLRAVAVAGVGGAAGYRAVRGPRQQNQGYDPYGKRLDPERVDVVWEGAFSKLEPDKRNAFGYCSVVKLNGAPVVDQQGDYITPDDLEDAAYRFVLKSRVGGDMHRRTADDRPHQAGQMIESMVFTPEKIAKMGLPRDFPVAWWVGFHYPGEEWDDIKSGRKRGFSIHGVGKRVDLPYDELMYGTGA